MLPPPSGTLLVAWIVLALVLVGLGTLVRRLGRVPAAAGTDPFLDFWTGWAALTVVLEAWHLVLPIDTRTLAFVASLGLLGLATDGRRPWRALPLPPGSSRRAGSGPSYSRSTSYRVLRSTGRNPASRTT